MHVQPQQRVSKRELRAALQRAQAERRAREQLKPNPPPKPKEQR